MKHIIALLLGFTLWATAAVAQQQDSIFSSYDDYASFVDSHVMKRNLIPLIQQLGGRDEFTIEQLRGLQSQFTGIWLKDFQHSSVFKEIDLGGGLRQEARVYWTGISYGFFYAMLHQREDELVVINFKLNTDVKAILDAF